MKFVFKPHQGKEQPYREALLAAGHVESATPDVVLIDFEVPVPVGDYHLWVDAAREKEAALVAYPHGFALVGEHQLTKEPYECAATFVHGPGNKKIREAYDYPNPVHWVGYPGPRIPLEPRECMKVLFAPHHPLGNGWMPDDARVANTRAFQILLDENVELTVRFIGGLQANGIWEETGVKYIPAQMDGTVSEGFDVVVAGGTYAANSLARGIPVVMYNQERDWRVELQGEEPKMVPGADFDFTEYPYDLSEPGVCERAAEEPESSAVIEWMERFMPPFQPQKFAYLVEEASLSRVS